MTKLTEMINLKTAIVGPAFLTALSGFIASPTQAISIGGSGWPNVFDYQSLIIDTEKNPDVAVEELTIRFTGTVQNPDAGDPPMLTRTSKNLKIQVSSSSYSANSEITDIDFSTTKTLEEIFNDINGGRSITINDDNIFEYTITLDNELKKVIALNSSEGSPAFEEIGFIVPTNITIGNGNGNGKPITLDVTKFNDPLTGLEEIVNKLDITFPITEGGELVQEFFPDTGLSLSKVKKVVPESHTTTPILSLGIFGLSVALKRKKSNKFLSK